MSSSPYTVNIGPYSLPESSYLSAESVQQLQQYRRTQGRWKETEGLLGCQHESEVRAFRTRWAERFYQQDNYQALRARYPVRCHLMTINGVSVEEFLPADGVIDAHQKKVLLNFHGGGFTGGARTNSHLESVPVAVMGRIKVISVDYRMAPEYRYPAATDDAVAVYRGLLTQYSPEDIGLFGTSSGGILVAQLLAQCIAKSLPLPSSVAMMAGVTQVWQGDSLHTMAPLLRVESNVELAACRMAYFDGVDLADSEVSPMESGKILARFPPAFLASSTRDWLLSSVVECHRRLTQLQVEAELHLWDGLNHAFHYNSRLPEAEELHQKLLRFFSRFMALTVNTKNS